jgi:hypothetical protein
VFGTTERLPQLVEQFLELHERVHLLERVARDLLQRFHHHHDLIVLDAGLQCLITNLHARASTARTPQGRLRQNAPPGRTVR